MTSPEILVTASSTVVAVVGGSLLAITFTPDEITGLVTALGIWIVAFTGLIGAIAAMVMNIRAQNAAARATAKAEVQAAADKAEAVAAREEERKIAEEERKAIAAQLHDVKGQNRVIEGKVDGTASRAVEEIKALRDTVARLEAASAREEKRAELLAQANASRPTGPVAAVVNGPVPLTAELDVHASAAATQAKAAEVQVDAAETQLKAAKGE